MSYGKGKQDAYAIGGQRLSSVVMLGNLYVIKVRS
jgi:hypothetical protein